MLKKSILFLGILFLFFACKKAKISPDEYPAYLNLQKGDLIIGNDTLKEHVYITWIYPYPDYYGTFTLPNRIPLLKKGEKDIFLQGGVPMNGGVLTPMKYPFWRFDSLRLSLETGKEYTYTPVFKYYADTNFVIPYYENFEDVGVDLEPYGNRADSIPIIPTTTEKFLGTKAGKIAFDTTKRYFEVQSSNTFSLPRDKEVWLEIALKGNQLLLTGLIEEKTDGTQIVYSFITLVPTPEKWRRTYVNLSSILSNLPANSKFRLYFFTDTYNRENATLFIDDIRILYFK